MKSQSPERDCLVAVVTSDADLSRFIDDCWYRIPDRVIGRLLAYRSLAEIRRIGLYQSGSVSKGLPGVIEVHGAIEGISVETRRTIIPEEPDHASADDAYHVVRVSSVERLEAPLTSVRPRRITFVRTTSERLLHARDINDLFIGTAAQETLWASLRELGAERRLFMTVSDQVMEVDFAIVNGGRSVAIMCGDDENYVPAAAAGEWSIVRFADAEVEQDLPSCIQQIMELLRAPQA